MHFYSVLLYWVRSFGSLFYDGIRGCLSNLYCMRFMHGPSSIQPASQWWAPYCLRSTLTPHDAGAHAVIHASVGACEDIYVGESLRQPIAELNSTRCSDLDPSGTCAHVFPASPVTHAAPHAVQWTHPPHPLENHSWQPLTSNLIRNKWEMFYLLLLRKPFHFSKPLRHPGIPFHFSCCILRH